MAADRLERILALVSSGGDALPGTARVCEVCAEVVGVSGTGIMLMSGESPAGAVCTTDRVSSLIEELQYTLGEGPCVDAYHLDRPVLEPDLADPDTPRWLAFTPPAVEAGARAIFGFPLQVGAVRLGALDLYRDQPGPLTDDQYADALVLAGVAARAVLATQAPAPPGEIGAEVEAGANFRLAVHQAAGMVSVQLGISVADALVRLRAYAFGNNRLLADVADEVVTRKLRLDDPSPGTEPER